MKGKEAGIVSHVPYQATKIILTQLDLALMHFTLSLPTWLIGKPQLEEVEEWGSALIPYFILGCPRKVQTGEVEDILFLKKNHGI